MRNTILQEMFLIIFFIVESYNSFYVIPLEYLHILVRMMAVSLIGITFLDGTHKGHEFSWDNPVDISILNTLKVFILLDIEGFKVIPLEADSVLESL